MCVLNGCFILCCRPEEEVKSLIAGKKTVKTYLIACIKSIVYHLYRVHTSTSAGYNELRWKLCFSSHTEHPRGTWGCEHGELDAARQKRWLRPRNALTVITN